ncbi:hypothetical protein CR513_05601, partial [Mucuna pruriens]
MEKRKELQHLIWELPRRRNPNNHRDETEGEEGRSFNGQSGDQVIEQSGRRFNIPMFSGEDAYVWINKVERNFYLNSMGERERLQAVMFGNGGACFILLKRKGDTILPKMVLPRDEKTKRTPSNELSKQRILPNEQLKTWFLTMLFLINILILIHL